MAKYYISNSTGNDGNPGTISQPYKNFVGKLDGSNALNPNDTVYFLAGDTWSGSNANILVKSNGTPGNQILLTRYGNGADPVFNGSALTTGWTNTSGTIYSKSGLFGTTKTVGVDGTYSLGKWNGTNSTLPNGTFRNESGTVYINLSDGSNPSGHSIYVPTFDINFGASCLVGGYNSNSFGQYVTYDHLNVIYSPSVGMAASSTGVTIQNCTVTGSGIDGILAYAELAGNGCFADHMTITGNTVTYNCSNGTGYGQGITVYATYPTVTFNLVHHNFMAGIDMLDADSNKSVNNFLIAFNIVHHNAQWNDAGSFDPEIYIDGANTGTIFGNLIYSGGGTTSNHVNGISVSAENAGKFTHDINIVNNLIYNASNYPIYLGYNHFQAGNLGYNVFIYNNTLQQLDPNFFVGCIGIEGSGSTGSGTVIQNNVMYKENTTAIYPYASSTDWGTNAANIHCDYNIYWNPGSTNLVNFGGFNLALASWQAAPYNQDAHSLFSDPKLANTTNASFDAHLNSGSPARGYHVTPWAETPVLQGTTLASNAYDTSLTDLGFHYLSNLPAPTESTGAGIRISMTGVFFR